MLQLQGRSLEAKDTKNLIALSWGGGSNPIVVQDDQIFGRMDMDKMDLIDISRQAVS